MNRLQKIRLLEKLNSGQISKNEFDILMTTSNIIAFKLKNDLIQDENNKSYSDNEFLNILESLQKLNKQALIMPDLLYDNKLYSNDFENLYPISYEFIKDKKDICVITGIKFID